MNTANASLEIFHTLVRAGFKEAEADKLAKQVISRVEAQETLATKSDLKDELHRNTRWLISVFIGVAFGQLAVMTGIMTLLLNFYIG